MDAERLKLGVGAAVVLVVGALGGGAVMLALGGGEADPPPVVPVFSQEPGSAQVIVDVQGAVERPGIVTLSTGARVLDAIAAAGGFREDAEQGAINLAREVNDGEQLVVPVQGEQAVEAPGAPASGLININRASAAELEALPRIGPATAESIVAFREEHGPFRTVDDLELVRGIGPATLEELRPLVTV